MNEKINNELKIIENSSKHDTDAISIKSEKTNSTNTSQYKKNINNRRKLEKSKQSTNNSNLKRYNRYFKTKLASNERVVHVFSCALQRNDNHLLIHGTLFITCKYYAFYSNLFGYQTKFEGKWYDVAFIKKENIALVFPTAIKIELNNNEKIVLASFMTRNQAFDSIVNVWQTAIFNKKNKNFNSKLSNNDENNNEISNCGCVGNDDNKKNSKELRARHASNPNSSSLSSSNSSICFENTKKLPKKMSDTSSLTSNSLSNSSIEESTQAIDQDESKDYEETNVGQTTTVTSTIRRRSMETNSNNNQKRFYNIDIIYRIKFFLNFIITVIINNGVNLKTKVLTISTSITSLSSITTHASNHLSKNTNKQQQQQQQQQQIIVGHVNTSSFNNFAVIIIFLIILSILYLYVFIILTQINHIEEKLVNLYKKLNF